MAKKTKPGTTAKAPALKIKKGDHVVVIAGRDRGREGDVIAVYPAQRRVLVHGVNIIRKNTKVNFQGARGAKEGGIVTQEAPIHVSNVALIDPETKKQARVGYRYDDDTKIRISRPGGKDI
jgi:large subunit ribosomal protein L24